MAKDCKRVSFVVRFLKMLNSTIPMYVINQSVSVYWIVSMRSYSFDISSTGFGLSEQPHINKRAR